jgi:O-antigen/teichoic acid export membrane protein
MTVYDVAARPSMLLRLVIGVLVSAIIPESAHLHEQGNKEALRRLYINMVRYSYLMILPLLAVLYAHMGGLLRAWVGDQFRAHSELALILITGYLVMPISAVANTMVVGLQKVRETLWIPVVATSINLVVSVVLLQYIGLAGLMVGIVVSQLFSFIPYAHAMGRFVGFHINDLYKPLLTPVLVALGSFLINAAAQHWLQGLTWVIGTIAAVTLVANLALTYCFMLQPGERAFLLDRMRAFWVRISPGPGNGVQ